MNRTNISPLKLKVKELIMKFTVTLFSDVLWG